MRTIKHTSLPATTLLNARHTAKLKLTHTATTAQLLHSWLTLPQR